jgi:hypothetical protein
MQFYQQSAVVEKRITVDQYAFTRLDVIIGCILAIVVASFIVIACAASIHLQGLKVETAADAAMALKPLVGQYATALFAFGLCNASVFAACILPLSTAFYICEGMGWESGVDNDFRTAPQFFWLFTIIPSQCTADRHHVHLSGSERRGAPLRSHLHAPADQQQEAHGGTCQRTHIQCHRLGHRGHHDRPDPPDDH